MFKILTIKVAGGFNDVLGLRPKPVRLIVPVSG